MQPTVWFMTYITCRLTAKNRDRLGNPIRSVIEYGLPLPFFLGPTPVHIPTSILIGSATLAQLKVVTNRHTDHETAVKYADV